MKTLIKKTFVLPLLTCFVGLMSCGNDVMTENPEESDVIRNGDIVDVTETVNQIIVNPTNASSEERSISVTAAPNSTVSVTANFTGDKTMRRVYTTKNTFSDGEGPQPFEFLGGDKKRDGSIDLAGEDKNEFSFTFNFEAPTNTNDVVQYVIWATSGRGDFRDITKRNSIDDVSGAVATITITAGTGANQTGFRSFTQTILAAPLADGRSNSFVSLFDEKTHKINEGSESLALWDFGYFYGSTRGASFHSVYDYPKVFAKDDRTQLHVSEFIGENIAELNRFYFKRTTVDFDAVNSFDDLENLTIATTDSERVQNLENGDVVEFLDQYGNKGLIRVTAITPGFGNNGRITFDVKAQFNAVPIKG